MSDFVSQGSFGKDAQGRDLLELPEDALRHEQLAQALIKRARQLRPGSVIALQGPWGRGKTDVLSRVARLTYAEDPPAGVAGRALWVNPWQYGTPDLLNPLVWELFRRVPEERLTGWDFKRTVSALARAGVSFGVKAATVSVPLAGGFLEAAGQQAVDLVEKRLTGRGQGTYLDDVAMMAWHFQRLCEQVLSKEEQEAGARLLICVDDLDRCLPDRQVALLQALRFLTSSGAPATILVAIDPTLVRQAVYAHYRTEAFNPEQYLDKMFHLRVNLPAVGPDDLGRLVQGKLKEEVLLETRFAPLAELLERQLGAGARELADIAGAALSLTDLRNPRVIDRIFTKLQVLATEESGLGALRRDEVRLLLTWLGICERWPEVRAALQDADQFFVERYREVAGRYRRRAGEAHVPSKVAAVERLPRPDDAPELCQLFSSVRINDEEAGRILEQIDAALVRLGL
ncbi:MAG: hypothetical protein H6741_23255 [Alphaproteobacteria bacterium]|nr:hypothetical protein [Alphaproteobacteria bacterium]